MLIALKIKNFADMNKTFSFAASTKERKFYPHLININQGKFLSVTGFPAISSETDIFFKCLHFLRQITIRTGASLAHENISPYCSLIQNTAEFSVVFRIFGTLYLYNLNLSPHAVTAESLYLCHSFDKKNPFSSQNANCIFERTQDAYPILNVHKSLHEQIQSTPQNATVLSKFKEKEEHSAYLRSAHTWFRKELFVFEDTNFLDFMSERGIFFEGVNLLEGKRICAAEVQDFLSKDIFAYLTNPEKEFFSVHVGENEIILSKKMQDKNSLNITFSAPPELFRKFITSLHAVKNEKYRVFAVPRITDTLDGFFSYLLLKIFLSDRYEYYNQLFFSSTDYRLFSPKLLRADEIQMPQTEQNMPQPEDTEQTAPPKTELSLQAQLKNSLPRPHISKTELEDNRKRPLPPWIFAAIALLIFFLLAIQ